jgi:hypothetical protein
MVDRGCYAFKIDRHTWLPWWLTTTTFLAAAGLSLWAVVEIPAKTLNYMAFLALFAKAGLNTPGRA